MAQMGWPAKCTGNDEGKFNHDKQNSTIETSQENRSKRSGRTVLFAAFTNGLASCCSNATEA
jgi:hypothetical protein